MKTNRFLALLVAAAMLFGVGACSDDEMEAPALSVSHESMSFNFDGSAETVGGASLEIKCNTAWTIVAEKGSEWVKCTPASGSGNATVKVTPTQSIVARVGYIDIVVNEALYRSVTVNQSAKPGPTLIKLTPELLTWKAEEVDARTIEIESKYLNGAKISATCDNTAFRVAVDGTTVTVKPAEKNVSLENDITATLTVSVAGGNSLQATLTQLKADKAPVPSISGSQPEELKWSSLNLTAQTIIVLGDNLEGATITATTDRPDIFNVEVLGLFVTVTPLKGNDSNADIAATLTIAADGGNSVTVSLLQARIKRGWVRAENMSGDLSGTYLLVYELRADDASRPGGHTIFNASLTKASSKDAVDGTDIRGYNNYIKATITDGQITAASTGKYDNGKTEDVNESTNGTAIPLSDLGKYTVTIGKSGNKYYLKAAGGKYIYSEAHANLLASDDLTTLEKVTIAADGAVSIESVNSNGDPLYLRFNDWTQVFRFFNSTSGDFAPVYLYKFVE